MHFPPFFYPLSIIFFPQHVILPEKMYIPALNIPSRLILTMFAPLGLVQRLLFLVEVVDFFLKRGPEEVFYFLIFQVPLSAVNPSIPDI